ncbi:Wzz/FepE/Etk N-terminal domain-containing protein [Thermodesulfobacteriota bacterium]
MESEQRQQIRRILDAVIRRRALIIICAMIAMVAGLGYYLTQPKSYESEALLSYQQQKVNPAPMSPDVQGRIKDIVSTLTQIVTSRTSLEQIINDVGLYNKARANMPMEDVIEMMRMNISIELSKQGDTFRIAFFGGDPKQVARVTNALAARFIEENLKYREERASETSAYTADELEMAKETLDRKEAVMRDYKLQYYNEMAGQRPTNMERLNGLQEQYQSRQNSIQDLERTRILLQDQINVRKEILEENAKLRRSLGPDEPENASLESDEDRLERLQYVLLRLRENYTDNHPSVRQVKRQIETIEQNLADQPHREELGVGSGDRSEGIEGLDKTLSEMQLQLKQIDLSIQELEKEKTALKALVEQYEQWIAAAPVREAEWSALTREYDQLKRHYDYLVSQNLQARSALNMERKQKGSQFKIEDPARVPETPVNPDFIKIMVIALLAGFAVGGSLAFSLELFDTSFRNPADLEAGVNAEVLCTVPYVGLKRETVRKRVFAIGGLFFYVICCGLLCALIIYFWQQGRIVI